MRPLVVAVARSRYAGSSSDTVSKYPASPDANYRAQRCRSSDEHRDGRHSSANSKASIYPAVPHGLDALEFLHPQTHKGANKT